jgi:hypothetical protein
LDKLVDFLLILGQNDAVILIAGILMISCERTAPALALGFYFFAVIFDGFLKNIFGVTDVSIAREHTVFPSAHMHRVASFGGFLVYQAFVRKLDGIAIGIVSCLILQAVALILGPIQTAFQIVAGVAVAIAEIVIYENAVTQFPAPKIWALVGFVSAKFVVFDAPLIFRSNIEPQWLEAACGLVATLESLYAFPDAVISNRNAQAALCLGVVALWLFLRWLLGGCRLWVAPLRVLLFPVLIIGVISLVGTEK